MFNRFAAALFAGLLLLAGAHVEVRAQQSTTADSPLGVQGLSDDEANGIKQMIDAWTKDMADGVTGWEKYWTSDAVLAAPGQERLAGKADIAAFARKTFGAGSSYSLDNWSIAGREDLAVVTNTVKWEPSGGASQTYNQMIVLRREQSGDWRVQSVLFAAAS